jgi:hypothetical protein
MCSRLRGSLGRYGLLGPRLLAWGGFGATGVSCSAGEHALTLPGGGRRINPAFWLSQYPQPNRKQAGRDHADYGVHPVSGRGLSKVRMQYLAATRASLLLGACLLLFHHSVAAAKPKFYPHATDRPATKQSRNQPAGRCSSIQLHLLLCQGALVVVLLSGGIHAKKHAASAVTAVALSVAGS